MAKTQFPFGCESYKMLLRGRFKGNEKSVRKLQAFYSRQIKLLTFLNQITETMGKRET